jgi:hypothetical protein
MDTPTLTAQISFESFLTGSFVMGSGMSYGGNGREFISVITVSSQTNCHCLLSPILFMDNILKDSMEEKSNDQR